METATLAGVLALSAPALSAQSSLHDEDVVVSLDGHPAVAHATIVRNAPGEVYVSQDDLERWDLPKQEPGITYGGARYYRIASDRATVRVDDRERPATLRIARIMPPADPARRATSAAREAPGSYLSYELDVDGGSSASLVGTLDYGMPIANGVAAAQLVALSTPDARRIVVPQASWERYDPRHGALFRIGDAMTFKHGFVAQIPFEGVQWSSSAVDLDRPRNGTSTLFYEAGIERLALGPSSLQLGSAMLDTGLTRALNDRIALQLHAFADDSTLLIGAGGIWSTRRAQLHLGIAGAASVGVMEFVSYRGTFGKFDARLDARFNGAPHVGLVPSGRPDPGRQISARLGFLPSPGTMITLSYADEVRPGSLRSHTMFLQYRAALGPRTIEINGASGATNGRATGGLRASSSFTFDQYRQLSLTNDTSNGTRLLEFERTLDSNQVGMGYDLRFGAGAMASSDASLVWQAPGAASHVELSRAAYGSTWHADVSGAMLFVHGAHASAQKVDQRHALAALRRQRTLRLRIVTEKGAPLPLGSAVRAVGETSQWAVAPDGWVALAGLDSGSTTLAIATPNGSCSVTVVVPEVLSREGDLGTYVCRR